MVYPMTYKISRPLCAFIMAVALLTLSCPAFAYSGEDLAPQPKITITQAREIALKADPGTVTDEELEHEDGGSGLRYSFDVKNGSVTQEIGVDAISGKVLENKAEGPNPD